MSGFLQVYFVGQHAQCGAVKTGSCTAENLQGTQGEFAAIFNLACTAREPDAMAMLDCAATEMRLFWTHFGHAGQGAEITIHPMNPYNKRIRWLRTLWGKTDLWFCVLGLGAARSLTNCALAEWDRKRSSRPGAYQYTR
jgi:hypothetical protein